MWQWLYKTSTARTLAFCGYQAPPYDYPYYWFKLDPKSKQDKVKVTHLKICQNFIFFSILKKTLHEHTFWSCLIRCANMKWIWRVLLKIQSRHDSVHRWTDEQTDGQQMDRGTRWNQHTPLLLPRVRGFWYGFVGVCSLTYCNGNFRFTRVSELLIVIL